MSQKILFSSLALTCLMLGNLHADGTTQESTSCGSSPKPVRFTARHIEGEGVGYHQGYTTLEGFFSPTRPWRDAWVPFLDLRGHIFNNGKLAANAGLGIRYLASSRVWGGNAYYDYRDTKHQHYNQVSAGFESLGKIWDFRINGYLPVGDKVSSLYGRAEFKRFKNHYMLLSRKREFVMKGANAEVGAHVDNIKHVPIYFAAGPYYLVGQGKAAWGGELRAAFDFYEHLRVEGNVSYDHIFRWIGQGQVSVNIPLGKRRQVKQRRSPSCSMAMALSERAVQRVDRMEIIPVSRQHRKTRAINPATGKPYFFWFVDNTSSSAGTFESPFPTLMQAQNASSPNDVIYVFSGDGTSTGMDAGIKLKNGQKLFGAGIPQTLLTTRGEIEIPAQGTGLPIITGPSGFIQCADDNEISGIHVLINEGSIAGIICNDIINTSIHHNIIDGSTIVSGGSGSGLISLSLNHRKIDVSNNAFLIGDAALASPLFGIHLFSSTADANYSFNNNLFSSPTGNGSSAVEFGVAGTPIGDFGSITIANNLLMGIGSNGVTTFGKAIGGFGFSGIGQIDIDHNTFNQTGSFGASIVHVRVQAGGNIASRITNNLWVNSTTPDRFAVQVINVDPTSLAYLKLTGNSSDATGYAYLEDNTAGGAFTADSFCNNGFLQQLGVITPGPLPIPSICLTE